MLNAILAPQAPELIQPRSLELNPPKESQLRQTAFRAFTVILNDELPLTTRILAVKALYREELTPESYEGLLLEYLSDNRDLTFLRSGECHNLRSAAQSMALEVVEFIGETLDKEQQSRTTFSRSSTEAFSSLQDLLDLCCPAYRINTKIVESCEEILGVPRNIGEAAANELKETLASAVITILDGFGFSCDSDNPSDIYKLEHAIWKATRTPGEIIRMVPFQVYDTGECPVSSIDFLHFGAHAALDRLKLQNFGDKIPAIKKEVKTWQELAFRIISEFGGEVTPDGNIIWTGSERPEEISALGKKLAAMNRAELEVSQREADPQGHLDIVTTLNRIESSTQALAGFKEALDNHNKGLKELEQKTIDRNAEVARRDAARESLIEQVKSILPRVEMLERGELKFHMMMKDLATLADSYQTLPNRDKELVIRGIARLGFAESQRWFSNIGKVYGLIERLCLTEFDNLTELAVESENSVEIKNSALRLKTLVMMSSYGNYLNYVNRLKATNLLDIVALDRFKFRVGEPGTRVLSAQEFEARKNPERCSVDYHRLQSRSSSSIPDSKSEHELTT